MYKTIKLRKKASYLKKTSTKYDKKLDLFHAGSFKIFKVTG